ncbi:hypothetical protein LL273_09260 [Marinobacter salarius]|uniref:hypothetical protein n=1 Tax=Marinobacter salarius TaxID=1420917 RepID=UPI001D17FF23|nr:hypothetical protein [Marinobacter salarius]MCC4283914.1 hypothetical protein [Marinobacter salarius]
MTKVYKMDPETLTVQCSESFGLYSLIWGAILPLFFAYLAAAAYAFNRRRGDIASALEALDLMQELTLLALDRVSGGKVDARQVQSLAQNLIRRLRMEALHRPRSVQKQVVQVLENFLPNAYVADGQRTDTPNDVLKRMNEAEASLLQMLREQTILEALKQGWSNPGMSVSFDQLTERFTSKPE